jgi:hypothetical protein
MHILILQGSAPAGQPPVSRQLEAVPVINESSARHKGAGQCLRVEVMD